LFTQLRVLFLLGLICTGKCVFAAKCSAFQKMKATSILLHDHVNLRSVRGRHLSRSRLLIAPSSKIGWLSFAQSLKIKTYRDLQVGVDGA
jgi:hypothetical protein